MNKGTLLNIAFAVSAFLVAFVAAGYADGH